MNINRHNYEEWFLLYADDELSVPERREVEAFMERNPDLAGELEIFRQMKLDPSEELTFSGKASLYREEEVSEEDSLVLSYLDGELHGEALASAERRLANEPALAAKLEQFRATVLPAEPIAFTDKASLYRKSERTAPVISMRWIRVAVAAAVVIAGAALWMNTGEQSAVSGQQPAIAKASGAPGNEQTTTNNQQPAFADAPAGTANNRQLAIVDAQTKSAVSDPAAKPDPGSGIRNTRISPVTNTPQERNINGSSEDVAVNNDKGLSTTDNRQSITSNNLPTPPNDVAVNTPTTDRSTQEIVDRPSVNTVAKSDYATQALLNPDKQDEPVLDEGNRSRKGPFRGLVRKANRFFNKATNPDPDKATVKVASFEIALGR